MLSWCTLNADVVSKLRTIGDTSDESAMHTVFKPNKLFDSLKEIC